ncbi:MAG: response regulator [Planctomycetota bacterium]|jgi:CheY-like chemotaxis protein
MIDARRILLADDDQALRSGVADLLANLGLDVLEAENGLEAVQIARARRIDAALLDLHMPTCTGLDAIPLLHSARAGLPCIVYSGDLTSELEHAARLAGAVAVLHKPVDPALLRHEVLRALELGPESGATPH